MEIKTVQDLLNILSDVYKNYGKKSEYGGCTPKVNGSLHPNADFVFRGLSNKNFKLIPKIFREGYEIASYDEPLERFKKEADSYLRSKCGDNKLLWMQYAQHFGVPTRLLDFSSNPLVALYFACNEDKDDDGALWIINEFRFNCYSCQKYIELKDEQSVSESEILQCYLYQSTEVEYEGDEDNEMPILFFPNYIDARMNVQSSRMMLWPMRSKALNGFMEADSYMNPSVEEEYSNKRFACEIIIPKEEKNNLLYQLDQLGINEKSIFPGLDSIGRYTDFIFKNKNKEDH